MTKNTPLLAIALVAIAATSGCQLCFLPCVVCAETSAPSLQRKATPLPEVPPLKWAGRVDEAPAENDAEDIDVVATRAAAVEIR